MTGFYIFHIFPLYFSKPIKTPYLVEREQAISVASLLYLGFWSRNLILEWSDQWLSCFDSRLSQKQRDYRTSDLAARATS